MSSEQIEVVRVPTIVVDPDITADELFDFYDRNDICEKNFTTEEAARVLVHSSVIVGAFIGDRLIGLARAMFDGLSADIGEISLDLEWQPPGAGNGSLLAGDPQGVGREMVTALLRKLREMGATFVSASIVEGVEEGFYEACGFEHNVGHKSYFIDRRPYVTGTGHWPE